MTRKIIVEVDDQLDNDFRFIIFKKYGMHQGGIKKACVEAIKKWIEENKDDSRSQ